MERRQFLFSLAAGGLTLIGAKNALGQVSEHDLVNLERVLAQGVQVTIMRNHGHRMILPDGHLRDRRSHAYNIRGRATHPHTVSLSSSGLARLAGGSPLRVMSSFNSGHSHVVLLAMNGSMEDEAPINESVM